MLWNILFTVLAILLAYVLCIWLIHSNLPKIYREMQQHRLPRRIYLCLCVIALVTLVVLREIWT